MVRLRHAAFYLALAEEASPAPRGPEQDVWLVRLDREQGNLRAALTRAQEARESEIALQVGGSARSILGGTCALRGRAPLAAGQLTQSRQRGDTDGGSPSVNG